MFAFVMASLMIAASDAPVAVPPSPGPAASLAGQPTRYCREIGTAPSRSQAILICRTKAQWARRDVCQGVTSYCAPTKRDASLPATLPGKPTAFALNEDSRILCKITKITGSRLRSANICLPMREWDRMHANSKEEVSDLQDHQSKRFTGEQ